MAASVLHLTYLDRVMEEYKCPVANVTTLPQKMVESIAQGRDSVSRVATHRNVEDSLTSEESNVRFTTEKVSHTWESMWLQDGCQSTQESAAIIDAS